MLFASPAASMAKANAWFVDASHPVFPVINHRLCIDYFLHHMAWIFALLTGGWAAVAGLFAVGASPYFYVVAALALVMVVTLWYGEWVLGERLHHEGYFYLCIVWWETVALIWAVSASYVHVRQAQEFVVEYWYELQVQIPIPFTTQLDEKQQISDNAIGIFGCGLVTAILYLPASSEAWRALGGIMRFSQLRFGAMLLDFVPLFAVAAATASYAVYAATISAYATEFSTDCELWQAATALLVLVAVLGSLWARIAWGVCFLHHAITAIVLAPLCFVQFVTSWTLHDRAGTVDAFVGSHWMHGVQYLVPPSYSAQNFDKYAQVCQTAMRQSAAAGFLLTVLLVCSIGLNLHAGAVLLSLGSDSQAYMTREELQQRNASLLARMTAAAADIVDVAKGRSDPGRMRLVSMSGSALDSAYEATEGRFGSFAAPPPSPSPAALRAPSGSRSSGYGTLSASADEATSLTMAARSRPQLQQYQHAPRTSEELGAAALMEKRRAELLGAIPRDQLAALQQDRYLMLVYERQIEELRVKVNCPSPGNFCRALAYYCSEVYLSNRACVLAAVFMLLACVGGIAGGLAEVAVLGECGALASSPATRHISITFEVESGVTNVARGSKYADIILTNMYPFGGLELDIEIVPVLPELKNNSVTLDIWAFGLSEDDLPSYSALYELVNLTNLQPITDDDQGGYTDVSVSLQPPSDAARKCLGARLRLAGRAGMMYAKLQTASALVNVTGNFRELSTNAAVPRAYQTLVVNTDTAAMTLQDCYVDKLGLKPLLGFPPSMNLTSGSGDIFLDQVTSSGIAVRTGGSIYSATVGSFSASNCEGICGDINFTTTGDGKIIIVQAFGAYNIYLRTEHGAIIAANTGMIVGKVMRLDSDDGPITMSNFLQAYNNETFVSTSGKIQGSIVITNRMYVTAVGESNVGFIELFAGCPAPGTALFNPPISGNYSDPLAVITADLGDIQILGIGGSPASNVYANMMSLYLDAQVGKVKVEANGGGLNGPYTVSSSKGKAVVEVDGKPGSLTGVLGSGTLGNNEIIIHSVKGNVQLSVLPSPL